MSNEDQGPPADQGPEPRPPPFGYPPQPPPPYGYPPQPPPPYGYPPQPPPPYGYAPPPPYGTTPHTQTDGTAITALVLAIASFALIPTFILAPVCPILAIVALALCPSSRRKIQSSNGAVTGEGLLTAARIVAWINLGLAALVLLLIGIGAAAGWWEDSYDYSLRLAMTVLG